MQTHTTHTFTTPPTHTHTMFQAVAFLKTPSWLIVCVQRENEIKKEKTEEKLEHVSPLILSSSFKILLTILGSLYSHMNSRMCLSISGRKKVEF